MSRYRKKPVVIEAVQWTGRNIEEVFALTGVSEITEGFVDDYLEIETLEGIMRAIKFDWIIKGVNGEIYPCKPDIFEKTYEPLNPTQSESEGE